MALSQNKGVFPTQIKGGETALLKRIAKAVLSPTATLRYKKNVQNKKHK